MQPCERICKEKKKYKNCQHDVGNQRARGFGLKFSFQFSCRVLMSFVVLLQGHSSFITHLDWSVDGQHLRSNSGDYELLYCKYFVFLTLEKINFLSCSLTLSGIYYSMHRKFSQYILRWFFGVLHSNLRSKLSFSNFFSFASSVLES